MPAGKKYRKTEYVIKTPKINRRMKLVLLADMHGKIFPDSNRGFLEDIKKESPDAVLIAGDMILAEEKKYEKSREITLFLLKGLADICPVFYGNGNHETKIKDLKDVYKDKGEKFEKEIQSYCRLMSNESEAVNLNGSEIVISGLETTRNYYKKWGKLSMETSYVRSLLGDCTEDKFNILIAHNPHYFDTYADWGADLTLSGHLHGGVVGFPGCGGVISPQFKLFFKYTAGCFEKNGKKLIVSRGLGEHLPPVRIRNPREYVVISIEPEEIEKK